MLVRWGSLGPFIVAERCVAAAERADEEGLPSPKQSGDGSQSNGLHPCRRRPSCPYFHSTANVSRAKQMTGLGGKKNGWTASRLTAWSLKIYGMVHGRRASRGAASQAMLTDLHARSFRMMLARTEDSAAWLVLRLLFLLGRTPSVPALPRRDVKCVLRSMYPVPHISSSELCLWRLITTTVRAQISLRLENGSKIEFIRFLLPKETKKLCGWFE